MKKKHDQRILDLPVNLVFKTGCLILSFLTFTGSLQPVKVLAQEEITVAEQKSSMTVEVNQDFEGVNEQADTEETFTLNSRSQKLEGDLFGSFLTDTPLFEYSHCASIYPNSIAELADGFLRIDAYEESKLLIERYDSAARLADTQTVKTALPIYGGFYAAENAYYVITGQKNEAENNNQPVLAIEKFSKDWTLQKQNILTGINTVIPFDAGNCAIAESGNKIIVHTCHSKYAAEDGKNHQSNMTFVFDLDDLSVIASTALSDTRATGYVSHSFNQFVRTDESALYRADLGDAYPRGVTIVKSDLSQPFQDCEYTIPFEIQGEQGNNYTGVSLGGFELSENTCLIAGRFLEQPLEVDGDVNRIINTEYGNIFLTVTSKDLQETKTVWLTNRSFDEKISTTPPQFVKINSNRFLILWQEKANGTVETHMRVVDGDGKKIAEGISQLPLTECQPILFSDQTVRWIAGKEQTPILCTVSLYGQFPTEGEDSSGKEDPSEEVKSVTMYRLYNPNSGEHFYTANAAERDHLKSLGWNYEGTGWTAPASSDRPVYRVYNPNAGDHHYTMNKAEKDRLVSIGWNDEGIGWYSADDNGAPLYRQYNPNAKAGAHNYTTNAAERDHLVSLGWNDEGIGWYGLKVQI